MERHKFKTDIKCGGCIAKVTPYLNSEGNILEWNVDTNDPDKILTVTVDGLKTSQIKEVVNKAGFKAEEL